MQTLGSDPDRARKIEIVPARAHVQDYANAKQGVIAGIMARAAAWRPISDRS
jgi:hypothetical protein